MEVALIPITGKPSLYPGLFLFTTPCRLVRPVQNLELGREELIGTMEQVSTACVMGGAGCACAVQLSGAWLVAGVKLGETSWGGNLYSL